MFGVNQIKHIMTETIRGELGPGTWDLGLCRMKSHSYGKHKLVLQRHVHMTCHSWPSTEHAQ